MISTVTWILRRVGAGVAALVLAATMVVAAAAPAQAAPEGCHGPARGYNIDSNQNIHAHNFWICDDGNDIGLLVSIQRFVSPGVWTTVASGRGFVSYFCDGHALNIYRAAGLPQFFNTCG